MSWHMAALCTVATVAILVVFASTPGIAGDFQADVVGFLDRHCVDCHSGTAPEGGLSLDAFRDEAGILAGRPRWRGILGRVAAADMPPADAGQPAAADREAFLAGVRTLFDRADAGPPDPGPAVIRRLNRVEHNRTIHDLMGIDCGVDRVFPADGVGYGFANIADVLTVSPLLMERYLDAAEEIAAIAVPREPPLPPALPSPATQAVFVADPAKPDAEQTRENLGRFATRAWRRPVEKADVDALCGIVDAAVAAGETREEGMRRAVAAVLASPRFVFRLESPAAPGSTGAVPVPDLELATRLSYFLWSSCPDDELLSLAAAGRLTAEIDAQVDRLLADPRSSALVDEFAMQWLGLGRIATHGVDTRVFPSWKPQLAADMVEETRRFLAEVFRSDLSILQLLDADFTWVSQGLAAHYRLDVQPPLRRGEWRRVSLAGTPRGGLLTQASLLTITSNPARTSPVKRGKWVLDQLLDEPPPTAPPNVPSIDDADRQMLTGTFRQKMEQHRADASCAGCHRRMDAYGFTLERFDAIGRWRERDATGAAIDDGGDLGPDRRIAGVAGLREHLQERRADFLHAFARKMLIYALGRGLEPCDESALAAIERRVQNDGYRFSALIHAIVDSVPFRMRRGAAQESGSPPAQPPSP